MMQTTTPTDADEDYDARLIAQKIPEDAPNDELAGSWAIAVSTVDRNQRTVLNQESLAALVDEAEERFDLDELVFTEPVANLWTGDDNKTVERVEWFETKRD